MIFIAGKSINRPLSGNGFTLLEVMISSVILTVSLLGVAGMYGFSSKFSYEARQHTQVTTIANEILERLRINKKAWINNIILKSDNQYYELQISNHSSDEKQKLGRSSFCTTDISQCHNSLIVEQDVNAWTTHLSSVFSSSVAMVCIRMLKNKNTDLVNVELSFNWSLEPEVNVNHFGGCNSNYDGIKCFYIKTTL